MKIGSDEVNFITGQKPAANVDHFPLIFCRSW
jgi:hypothetical protein